ncbi:hypothetical protein D1007_26340 [Hordeum vulgare]|nr:hypothetical protein D1007_26340 [Hordeum vulgare]
MTDFIPTAIDSSSSFDDDRSIPIAMDSTTPRVFASTEKVEVAEVEDEEEEDPEEIEFESGKDSIDSDSIPAAFPPSPPRHRRAYSNVFMPYVPLEHFQNLAFAYVNPPHPSPHACIRRALSTAVGDSRVAI